MRAERGVAPLLLSLSLALLALHGARADDTSTGLQLAQDAARPMPAVRPNVPPVEVPAPLAPETGQDRIDTGTAAGAADGLKRQALSITDKREASSQYAIEVRSVTFSGNRVIATSRLDTVAQPYVGRTLEPSDIEALRNALTLYYVQAGYLNSGAEPPVYDASSKSLRFTVVEGRLTAIEPHGLGWLRPYYVSSRLLGEPGEVLDMAVLRERFQALLADPLISRANAKVLPGSTPGEAVLQVDVERARPYGLSFFANNYRPTSIGQGQGGTSAWVRNLTGFGDLLDASYLKHPGGGQSDSRSADWHLPFDAGRGEIMLEADRGASSVVDAALLQLGIRSESTSRQASVKEAVYQDGQREQLSLGLDYLSRDSQTYLLGEKFSFTPGSIDGHVAEHGFRLWQEYAARSENQVAVGRLTYARMSNNLVSQSGAPGVVNSVRDRVQYWLAQGQYNRVVLDDGSQLTVKLSAQQASQNLPSLDQMSVGGLATVRGYLENEFVRDIGRVLSLGFDHPYQLLKGDVAGSFGPFVDLGQSKNVGGTTASIASAGLVGRIAWNRLRLDLSAARRLHEPSGITAPKGGLQQDGIELQLSYDVFARN